jgi:hypothetical protein
MKLLFLDFDGVLNCQDDFRMNKGKGSDIINPLFLWRLHKIIEETKAHIVVSSAWRIIHSESQLQGFINLTILGITDSKGVRGEQILRFIETKTMKENFKGFVVLDDSADAITPFIGEPNFVHTSFMEGLTHQKMQEAIFKLNTQKAI